MFERSTLRVYLACACGILSLATMSVSADSSYQFSLGTYYSDLDYDDSADGEGMGLYASAYLEPVKLNGSIPYNLAPFYTRTSGLFLNSSKSRVTGLEENIRGEVLNKADNHLSSIGMRLANSELPVWAALDYTRVGSSHYEFSNGRKPAVNRRYIKSATVGWFINETLGVYSFYEDDEEDSYGVGTHYLYNLGDLGFIEAGLQYTKIDSEDADEIVDGTVRNANVGLMDESIRTVSLSYFPTVKTEIGLKYRKMDYNHDTYSYSMTVNASYYILSNLQLGMSYHDLSQDEFARRVGKMEYKSLSGNVSFKF